MNVPRGAALAAALALLATTMSAFAQSKTPAPDAVYAAFQQGQYLTAYALATQRIEEHKDPKAMTLVGELLAGGLGVKPDERRAAYWYDLAAKAGDREAIYALGLMHLEGRGVERSREQAARRFREAAERGHPAAAYNLALLYLEGKAFPRDVLAALRWFRVGAEQDLADAQHALAILYKEGDGIQKDPHQAVRWLERAAKLDHVPAMVELAIAVFNGDGAQRDEARAAKLFREAALRGNPIAQNRYARLLASGRAVEQNSVDACAWHQLARTRSVGDPSLDSVCDTLAPAGKEAAARRLELWLKGAAESRS
ncbi:MAG TPA: tetratricopeptide repeat protein [Xanthobacteraceae bacterium]